MKNPLGPTAVFLAILILASLALAALVACEAPEPTRPAVPPTEIPAPPPPMAPPTSGQTAETDAAERPSPTAVALASTPTTAPSSTELQKPLKVAGPASPGDGESELLASLASLPLEFRDNGIWFSNPKQSLEVADASRPADLAELESWPKDQRQKYATNSGVPVSNLVITMRQTMPYWEEAYGFSYFEIDAVTVTGMETLMPFETNYLAGEFDEEAIVRSLAELGYHTESAGDDVYYAIRDDREQDTSLRNPATRSAFGYANRIFVGDNLLVVSPDTTPVLQVIRARNGKVPSVADSEAFAGIAAELSDPLTAALLTRQAALHSDLGIPGDQVPGADDRPEEWQALHEWEAFGAGFGTTAETATLRFVLYYPHYYPHPDWAELDAEALVERIESYLPGLGRWDLVHEFCESWSPSVRVHGNGSMLTVKCKIPNSDGSGRLALGVTSLVPMRLLGFLAP